MLTKQCKKCKQFKSFGDFYEQKGSKDGLRPHCKKCSNEIRLERYRTLTPEQLKNYTLMTKFKISLEDYEKMLENQHGKCAICKTSKTGNRCKYFAVDHDHTSGKIRGLLCQSCNTGLGFFKDNEYFLAGAINYLSKEKEFFQNESIREYTRKCTDFILRG
jgi:hypothetical protein